MYPFLIEIERYSITFTVKIKLYLKMQINKDYLYIKYIYYQKQ